MTTDISRRRYRIAVLSLGILVIASCSSGTDTRNTTPSPEESAPEAITVTTDAFPPTDPAEAEPPAPAPTATESASPAPVSTDEAPSETLPTEPFPRDSALGAQLAGTGISPTAYTVGEFTFDALIAGPPDGAPVLLLHGFPSTNYQWRFQIVALADAGYRVIAPNQRGYSPGARPANIADYDIELLAQDVVDIASAAGVDRFHLAGHDWGASVAWRVGINHPDRLLSLTAVSVPHPAAYGTARLDPTGEQTAKAGYINNFVEAGFEDVMVANDSAFLTQIYAGVGLTDEEMQPYLDVLGTTEASRAALNWYRANSLDVTPDDLAVATPTLFVFSTNDCCLGRDAADLTVDYVTGPYTYEVLDGVSHWITEEAPAKLNAFLLTHLAAN